jgi:dolichyl-phosphate beta-glucosyltransferase
LPKVLAFAESQEFPVEVLLVDNASDDGTADIIQTAVDSHSIVSSLYQPIRGKGAAVRMGMMSGRGEYLFVYDADMAMPVEEISRFLPPGLSDYQVAIASREVPGAVRHNEPWHRHLMGRVFNLIVRVLTVPGIQDTQCGFKCFRRQAAHDIFTTQVIDGWAFDVEVLYIALKRGYRISEVPINWHYGKGSRISPIRDSLNMVLEVLRIRRNGQAGIYDRPTTPLHG